MAFNPDREDYDRMVLRFMESLKGRDLSDDDVEREVASFGRLYSNERDTLPQSDVERAFHLVAGAASIIDYQLPFASDTEAPTLIKRADDLLHEAIALDPHCHDARRMLAAAEYPSYEGYYQLLKDECDSVCDVCSRRAEEVREKGELGTFITRLEMRPAIRHLATLASKAVICGHNREAIRWYERALELDPLDEADVRFTAAIAYAKLEDESGLESLARAARSLGVERPHDHDDAWILIARMALAYKRRDYPAALAALKNVIKVYPNAAFCIIAMHELPDGVYSRLFVEPFSEDELILAVSECTVLFQEGVDRDARGSLGAWAIRCARELDPAAAKRFDREIERGEADGRP